MANCKGGNGRSCSGEAELGCMMCGKDICTDHVSVKSTEEEIICTDCGKAN